MVREMPWKHRVCGRVVCCYLEEEVATAGLADALGERHVVDPVRHGADCPTRHKIQKTG